MVEERPQWIPDNSRLKGTQRDGLVYESRVAKLLRALWGADNVLHNPWVSYEDKYGKGWCQPDIVVSRESAPLLIIECKLTATHTAFKQLKNFYLPVVSKIYGMRRKDIKLVQICKNLTPKFKDELILDGLDDMFTGSWPVATLRLARLPRMT